MNYQDENEYPVEVLAMFSVQHEAIARTEYPDWDGDGVVPCVDLVFVQWFHDVRDASTFNLTCDDHEADWRSCHGQVPSLRYVRLHSTFGLMYTGAMIRPAILVPQCAPSSTLESWDADATVIPGMFCVNDFF
jgi:hypothetical protein